jgi:hypothetical protein
MPIAVVTHTQFNWDGNLPTAERPLTMSGRDLPANALLLPHYHPWGQFTYAMQGVMRVTANNSSWIVPPQRAIWIAPNVVHAVAMLETARLRPLCVHASRSPFSGLDCKVLEVSPLLRELIATLEQHDQNEQSPRERLLGEMILDEMPRCAVRPVRVPLLCPLAPASAAGARGAADRARRAAVAGVGATGLRQPVGVLGHVQENLRLLAVDFFFMKQ